MAEAKGIIKRTNAYFIDPTMVKRKEGFNPRFDFGEIESLAQSIEANGILMPIRVKRAGEGFELIDGDRRLTAVELLLKKGKSFDEGIPAIIVDKAMDDVTALIQMFEANTGKPFLPLEEAEAYRRMREAKMTIKQICAAVGRAHTHVYSTLALLDADESVQEAVKSGAVNGSLAKKIAVKAAGDKKAQKELVDKARSGKKGKKEVSVEVEQMQKGNRKRVKLVETQEIKVLSAEKIQALELKVIADMKPLVESLGLTGENVKPFISESDDRAAAFYFGALLALRAAMGNSVPLQV